MNESGREPFTLKKTFFLSSFPSFPRGHEREGSYGGGERLELLTEKRLNKESNSVHNSKQCLTIDLIETF